MVFLIKNIICCKDTVVNIKCTSDKRDTLGPRGVSLISDCHLYQKSDVQLLVYEIALSTINESHNSRPVECNLSSERMIELCYNVFLC